MCLYTLLWVPGYTGQLWLKPMLVSLMYVVSSAANLLAKTQHGLIILAGFSKPWSHSVVLNE